MIKSELVRRIAMRNFGLYERDAERIVSAVLSRIADGLADGKRFELRG